MPFRPPRIDFSSQNHALQRNIRTGIWQVRTIVVVVLPRMSWRMGLWP
jgi:hypothetical protein